MSRIGTRLTKAENNTSPEGNPFATGRYCIMVTIPSPRDGNNTKVKDRETGELFPLEGRWSEKWEEYKASIAGRNDVGFTVTIGGNGG